MTKMMISGYVIGTLIAAFVLHVAIALIAPGDAGTVVALGSFLIFLILVFFLAFVGLIAFPVAALVSILFLPLVRPHPVLAAIFCIMVGLGVGALVTANGFQIGRGDFWSGPLVGSVYGAVWFVVVYKSHDASGNIKHHTPVTRA